MKFERVRFGMMAGLLAVGALTATNFAPAQTAPQPGEDRVIYGEDDRRDVYQVTDPLQLELQRSTCALIAVANLTYHPDTDTYTIPNSPWTVGGKPGCEGEPFRDQPSVANCSGFLVGPDLVATAGHCLDNTDLNQWAYVFGFEMADATTPILSFSSNRVYLGAAIVAHALAGGAGDDYNVIRLDRAVSHPDISPLEIRRDGTIPVGTKVGVIGHPAGLPSKISWGDNTTVRTNSATSYFTANLDTYGGNSGSAVFNQVTGLVEGILVRGQTDYVVGSTCFQSNRLPDDNPQHEDSTKITRLAAFIPALAPHVTVSGQTVPEFLMPGGSGQVSITLGNSFETAHAVMGTLTSPQEHVTITGSPQNYGDIAFGAPVTRMFGVQLGAEYPCGVPVQLDLAIQFTEGDGAGELAIPVGEPGAPSDPQTFPAAGLPMNIVDNTTIEAPVSVAQTGEVADVNVVNLDITHTWDSDLIITLTSPAGTVVTLAEQRGSSGDNFVDTVFDDEAVTPIGNGSAPFTGSFIPDSPLNAFDGESAAGIWKLKVQDTASGDTGQLTAWSVRIQTTERTCTVVETPKVAFQTGTSSFPEDQGVADIMLAFTPAVGPGGASIDYRVSGGTAERGVDFDFAARATSDGTLQVAEGAATAAISVLFVDDVLFENDETVELELLNPVGCELSGTGPVFHTLTITNEDPLPSADEIRAQILGTMAHAEVRDANGDGVVDIADESFVLDRQTR
ncbi:proprotein convertase P-domain-containing protein [Candidatus Poribacteria bacterium]|nr:proprotein convertase P-domain-containing protein [Candidatus Poribacteria bacterium]